MRKIKSIGVIGLGYVGLPLALQAEAKGFKVVGIEKSKHKLKALNNKQPIIDDDIASKRLSDSKIEFTDDYSTLSSVDAAIVCVPTPVDKNKQPDLSLVRKAAVEAAQHLKEGSSLVIESTINPGVCEEVVIPAIEKATDHIIGKTLHLAHCPERINPGDDKWHVGNINRVVGAESPKGLELIANFYDQLIDAKVKRMGSIKEAEAVKIVENTFRDVNIAFVNELAMSFAKLGINVNNVIDGAATKPFAFMPHYPGIGVGGHCIPVDPYYLIEYARGKGFKHKFLSLARSINESMPVYAVDALESIFIEKAQGTLEDKKVLVLGLSYKSDVGDDRESPAYTVIDALKARKANVTTFDPYISSTSSPDNLDVAIADKDAVILVTKHREFLELSPQSLAHLTAFIDGRNAFADKRDQFFEHNVEYVGIGT